MIRTPENSIPEHLIIISNKYIFSIEKMQPISVQSLGKYTWYMLWSWESGKIMPKEQCDFDYKKTLKSLIHKIWIVHFYWRSVQMLEYTPEWHSRDSTYQFSTFSECFTHKDVRKTQQDNRMSIQFVMRIMNLSIITADQWNSSLILCAPCDISRMSFDQSGFLLSSVPNGHVIKPYLYFFYFKQ